MREITKRPLAEADLLEIWLYTFEKWGEDQATRYLRSLNERIGELAIEPEGVGTSSLGNLRAGYYSARVRRHLVLYTFDDLEVRVHRVLHQVRDLLQRLDESE